MQVGARAISEQPTGASPGVEGPVGNAALRLTAALGALPLEMPPYPTAMIWPPVFILGVLTLAWIAAVDFHAGASRPLEPIVTIVFLMLVAAYLTKRGMLPMLSCFFGMTAWLGAFALAASHASYVTATANLPDWDATFSSMDRLVGLDWPVLMMAVAHNETVDSAGIWVYSHTAQQMLFALVVLYATWNYDRLDTVLKLLLLAGFSALIGGVLFPAAGAYHHFGITRAGAEFLAASPGFDHPPHFLALRSGQLHEFPEQWQGLVQFPSFHTLYTLIAAYGVWNIRFIGPVSAMFSVLVVLTTVPIGGHYLIDLFAAVGIFAAGVWMFDGKVNSTLRPSVASAKKLIWR